MAPLVDDLGDVDAVAEALGHELGGRLARFDLGSARPLVPAIADAIASRAREIADGEKVLAAARERDALQAAQRAERQAEAERRRIEDERFSARAAEEAEYREWLARQNDRPA
jgi:hypothetical protein